MFHFAPDILARAGPVAQRRYDVLMFLEYVFGETIDYDNAQPLFYAISTAAFLGYQGSFDDDDEGDASQAKLLLPTWWDLLLEFQTAVCSLLCVPG